MQDFPAKIVIASLASYFLYKLKLLNLIGKKMGMIEELSFFVTRTSGAQSFPFACLSKPVNNPVPLQLDVSFPSLKDIKWSLSRLIYLFNIQLEKNVAM